jgi:hypothetical protein
MAEGELVLDMCALTLPRRMQLIRAPGAPAFVNSPMARELLHWGVKNHGLAQVSWTDYLRLTVAGGPTEKQPLFVNPLFVFKFVCRFQLPQGNIGNIGRELFSAPAREYSEKCFQLPHG